ncbi:MAG: 4-hydroxy-tetrahydrodipicolinate reductase [Armatimonadota bacterium]|nr:4-hydroxy-tetrahydrodipicolinate reductase [Armatimonadota bacterium]MDR7438406.1 4-hydroxy-tetrahydrodipicolinate reductase [Armatimonadota bacterium]MDR7562205.1 4-hydroxy-tetrahydrodipicolinate reductase [Armatimonadota bacterium]MDR7567185.1 4-hydroxy-tetrahydrodipicolinate reductase [Armatimonadota bacterium]MDR7601250.1 4-hydroxy-tetrahydrodipicolinate reductase [Armatimonadota bacterium]
MRQPAPSVLRVAVSGAAGRMGRAVVRAVVREPDLRLVAAFGHTRALGEDAGEVAGVGPMGIPIRPAEEIEGLAADVLVDFTAGAATVANALRAVKRGVRPVVGGTGYDPAALGALERACGERALGGVVAPNFALGAALMMRFAQLAARHFPHVEIVEFHHDRKKDAPSGTALRTAQLIASARSALPEPKVQETETVPGARGGAYGGIRVHSVRLPGLMAHQEVIFGGPGQILRIRHDATGEEAYLPGVLLAIRRVVELDRLVVGLENLLPLEG